MLKQKDLTLVIPSSNNLRHLKNAYNSIKRNAWHCKIVMLDDASTDGTFEWLSGLNDDNITAIYRSSERVGHTILYDKGIELAETDVVGIMHADMILGPNYVENTLKHLRPGAVVCGTRVEPPLHPEGKEKIIKDFGLDFDSLNIEAFDEFCRTTMVEYNDIITRGMFAPWVIYKQDFVNMHGHDAVFAPFPYEDSDIFQRWMLAGYELAQARDAFVYHLTCRGHRWTEEIGKNDNYFQVAEAKAQRNYIRKWGSWIQNDEYQYPIIKPRYMKSFVVENCTPEILNLLEPWCDKIYVNEGLISEYVALEQPRTGLNLTDRVRPISDTPDTDIIVTFDARQLNQESFQFIQNIQDILRDSLTDLGVYEYGIFKIEVLDDEDHTHKLIQPWVKNVF